MSKYKKFIKAKIKKPDGQRLIMTCKGRVAETLDALIQKGNAGITALEMGAWAFRLAAYVHILRDEYQLRGVIITTREPHDGGSHARYKLICSAVDITERENG